MPVGELLMISIKIMACLFVGYDFTKLSGLMLIDAHDYRLASLR
jgi:hypothetical protein